MAKFIQRYLRMGKLLFVLLLYVYLIKRRNHCKAAREWQEVTHHCWSPGGHREQMRWDDETTASQLHVLLVSLGYCLNLRTALRCRTALGWTFRGSAYCQLICAVNKQKRLDFARANLSDNFANVIFMDECSVQLESHRRCCRKQGEPPQNKPW